MFDRQPLPPASPCSHAGGRNAKVRLAFCWSRAVRNRLPAAICSARPVDASNVVSTPPAQASETEGLSVRSVPRVTATPIADPKGGGGCSLAFSERGWAPWAGRLDTTGPRPRRGGVNVQRTLPLG